MIKVKISGETKEIPERWEEVTLKHFKEISKGTDSIRLMEIFLDIRPGEIVEIKDDLWEAYFGFSQIGTVDPPDFKRLHKVLTVDGVDHPLPSPKSGRWYQWILFEQMFQLEEPPPNLMERTLAIFMQPILDGSHSMERVDEIEKEMLKVPAFQAVPAYSFFFKEIFENQKVWRDRFESVEMDAEIMEAYLLAGSNKLSKHYHIQIVDEFAKDYGYTHEEVYYLDWILVLSITYYNREKHSIDMKAQRIMSENISNKR